MCVIVNYNVFCLHSPGDYSVGSSVISWCIFYLYLPGCLSFCGIMLLLSMDWPKNLTPPKSPAILLQSWTHMYACVKELNVYLFLEVLISLLYHRWPCLFMALNAALGESRCPTWMELIISRTNEFIPPILIPHSEMSHVSIICQWSLETWLYFLQWFETIMVRISWWWWIQEVQTLRLNSIPLWVEVDSLLVCLVVTYDF